MEKGVTVTVTCQKLMSLAECSCRMTEYADPDGKRLITILDSQDGTPVRVVLDRQCLLSGCCKSGLFRTCKGTILRMLHQYYSRLGKPEEEVIACLEFENLQRTVRK